MPIGQVNGVVQQFRAVLRVLAMAMVIVALAGAAGLLYQVQAGEQPTATKGQLIAQKNQQPAKPKPGELLVLPRQARDGGMPKAREKLLAKTDEELMAGWWTIVSGDNAHPTFVRDRADLEVVKEY